MCGIPSPNWHISSLICGCELWGWSKSLLTTAPWYSCPRRREFWKAIVTTRSIWGRVLANLYKSHVMEGWIYFFRMVCNKSKHVCYIVTNLHGKRKRNTFQRDPSLLALLSVVKNIWWVWILQIGKPIQMSFPPHSSYHSRIMFLYEQLRYTVAPTSNKTSKLSLLKGLLWGRLRMLRRALLRRSCPIWQLPRHERLHSLDVHGVLGVTKVHQLNM